MTQYLNMKWDQSKTSKFIEMFRNKRELWDPNWEHFKNRKKRDEAWLELSKSLDTPKEVLERKMNKLIVLFDLETDKGKLTLKKNLEQEWCFYSQLLFLRSRNICVTTTTKKGADENRFLEKAKVWDWMLLTAGLVTGLIWQLTESLQSSELGLTSMTSHLHSSAAETNLTMHKYFVNEQTCPLSSLDQLYLYTRNHNKVPSESSNLHHNHLSSQLNNDHNFTLENLLNTTNVKMSARICVSLTSFDLPPRKQIIVNCSQRNPNPYGTNLTSLASEIILSQDATGDDFLHKHETLQQSCQSYE